MARCGLLGKVPSFEGQRTIIHHRNFSPTDNRPENLRFMGDRDHMSYHRSIAERNLHFQLPEFENKRKAALSAKAKTPEGHLYLAERGTKNILAYMANKPTPEVSSISMTLGEKIHGIPLAIGVGGLAERISKAQYDIIETMKECIAEFKAIREEQHYAEAAE